MLKRHVVSPMKQKTSFAVWCWVFCHAISSDSVRFYAVDYNLVICSWSHIRFHGETSSLNIPSHPWLPWQSLQAWAAASRSHTLKDGSFPQEMCSAEHTKEDWCRNLKSTQTEATLVVTHLAACVAWRGISACWWKIHSAKYLQGRQFEMTVRGV